MKNLHYLSMIWTHVCHHLTPPFLPPRASLPYHYHYHYHSGGAADGGGCLCGVGAVVAQQSLQLSTWRGHEGVLQAIVPRAVH